jgi:osmotically inducible protein OsmC
MDATRMKEHSMVDRSASATWEGDLFAGKGVTRLDSAMAPPMDVSWSARAENPEGQTSPEELLAAAHSTCYSMAFSNMLAKNGTPPNRLDTNAVVSFEKGESGFSITRSAITVRGDVPGIDVDTFERIAQEAKVGCPVSRALANNVEITLDAALA